MCGIIAYLGKNPALRILIEGLLRMEYRGYDSAGVCTVETGEDGVTSLRVVKRKGKVNVLKDAVVEAQHLGHLGIAHTRWATHGPPTDVNSHPHMSMDGSVAVVHNGIIENHVALKKALEAKGYVFTSATDTEVLAHLIQDIRSQMPEKPLETIVRSALKEVHGAYGVAVVFADRPDLLIGARQGSPLILGVMEDGGYVLASDGAAIVAHTKDVVYMEEGTMVTITPAGHSVSSVSDGEVLADVVERLEMDLSAIEKGGHKHFMIKEILEQPKVLSNCMRGRIARGVPHVTMGGLEPYMERISKARRIIICACGTSFHAGMVGEYMIESLARVPVEVEYASEYRYRKPIIFDDDVVLAISQSGETADTLQAVREAQRGGALALGLVNVVGSQIARTTDAGVYLHVGPEIGVASTKAFTGQVLVLAMFSVKLAHYMGKMSDEEAIAAIDAMLDLPDAIAGVLPKAVDTLPSLAKLYRMASSFLYLGRGYQFPVALEGALKLKEISYIHAEGLAAAEMKHGPIALIDQFMPVVVVAPANDEVYGIVSANVKEVRARYGSVIVVTTEGNHDFDEDAEAVIHVPPTMDFLSPILTVIPLQLLSYYIADMRGCAIDQPRNLAKSVTVE
jgi:glucosamine--fructose-6-phosphate aminotransferase (isomerizing)